MALMIGDGKRAADMKALAESLDLAQVGFLAQVLVYAAEGDYSMFPEMYVHIANRWNAADPAERKRAAEEGEARYFTEEARERYEREYADADRAGAEARAARGEGKIIIP
jgi:hypothetical protein